MPACPSGANVLSHSRLVKATPTLYLPSEHESTYSYVLFMHHGTFANLCYDQCMRVSRWLYQNALTMLVDGLFDELGTLEQL